MPPVAHTGPRLVITSEDRSATSLRSLYFWPYHCFLEGAPFYWSCQLFSWMRGYRSRLLRFLPVNGKGTGATLLSLTKTWGLPLTDDQSPSQSCTTDQPILGSR